MSTSTATDSTIRDRTILSAKPRSAGQSHSKYEGPPASVLEFVAQTGQPIKDPKVKKLVRTHARNYVSRAKGIPPKNQSLLNFSLTVPESFTEHGLGTDEHGLEYFESPDGFKQIDITEDLGDEDLLGMDSSQQTLSIDFMDEMISLEPIRESNALHRLAKDHGTIQSTVADNVTTVDLTLSSPNVVRERVGRPKRKGGCKSCKQRHLKCDGSKPSCLRCLKLGIKCEGNVAPERLVNRNAAPNSFTFELSQYCPSVTLPYADENEARYFILFEKETAAELSGVFPTSFWSQIIPQESHSQDFVRHAVVSIAALNRAIKLENIAKQSGNNGLISHREAVNQREFALKHYDKALKAMRNISWREKTHLRKVLIATLLVVVFETMVMQPDLAYKHALIGDRLICHWLHANPHALTHTEGISSPVTAAVEDELLMTFGRYDAQLLVFIDHRGAAMHKRGRDLCADTMRHMPVSFKGLEEAAAYWQVVMRRAGHFLFAALSETDSARFERTFKESVPGRVLEMNSSTSVYCSPYVIPDTLEEQKNVHLEDVTRWLAAFDSLWLQVHQSETDLQYAVAISLLRMYSLSLRILILGTTFTLESSYDHLLPIFTEIVQLARFVDANLQPSYHFHLSTAPSLWVVLLRCRDPVVRREALATLRATKIDGPWDRWMIAKVGEWIMEVEEEGMSLQNGYIEESQRLRLTRLVIGMQEKKVWVQCVRRELPGAELTPELVWLERAISDW